MSTTGHRASRAIRMAMAVRAAAMLPSLLLSWLKCCKIWHLRRTNLRISLLVVHSGRILALCLKVDLVYGHIQAQQISRDQIAPSPGNMEIFPHLPSYAI